MFIADASGAGYRMKLPSDRFLISLIAAHVIGVSAMAQSPSSPPTNDIECTHHLAFAGTDGVQSIAFSPDSRSIFVHLHAPSINLWTIAFYYWPECIGAITIGLFLLSVITFMRVVHRPQVKGEPYCRRCNYNLSTHVTNDPIQPGRRWVAAPETKCPECGVELHRRKPRRGRKSWQRLAPVSAGFLLSAVALAVVFLVGVQRFRTINHWMNWSWEWTNTLAEKPRFACLKKWQVSADRVMQIDFDEIETRRSLISTPMPSYNKISVSPDGEDLFLSGVGSNVVSRYSARTGRLRATFRAPGHTTQHRRPAIIDFSTNGDRAYVSWLDRQQNLCGVSAWNLMTNKGQTLFTTAAHIDQRNGRNFPYPRHFLLRADDDAPRFVSFPDFMEAFPTKTYRIREHVVGELNEREFQPATMPDYAREPVLTPDGNHMIVPARYGWFVLVIDVATGEVANQLSSNGEPFAFALTLSRDGSLMAVASMRSIRLRDMKESIWLARTLRLPAGVYGPRLWISNDNRWVAAVCQKNLGGLGNSTQTQPTKQPGTQAARGGFTHELVLWDLSKLQRE
jgi:WD40 repeat protein